MGKPTKAAENPYCKARIGCSAYNDILKSREGASEVTGIDRTRIAHIELDTVTPYPDEVVLMAAMANELSLFKPVSDWKAVCSKSGYLHH